MRHLAIFISALLIAGCAAVPPLDPSQCSSRLRELQGRVDSAWAAADQLCAERVSAARVASGDSPDTEVAVLQCRAAKLRAGGPGNYSAQDAADAYAWATPDPADAPMVRASGIAKTAAAEMNELKAGVCASGDNP